MSGFVGFSQEVFESCEPSERIRTPIRALKRLKEEIEPRLRRMNPNLSGHVSRTKVPGTNEYNDWAWLYFNTIGTGAYRYSQLTVNVSPTRLYVGVNIKRPFEYYLLQKEIRKEENSALFEQIINTLSGREWIVTRKNGNWESEEPRRYSPQEIRGLLLSRDLYWINAVFEKDNPILGTRHIVNEIIEIFTDLYNIYAFASENDIIPQPMPKNGIFTHTIIPDAEESAPKSDQAIRDEVLRFLASLSSVRESGKFHLPGRKDQYSIKRTAIELNLEPCKIDYQGNPVIIFSDKPLEPEILENYSSFRQILDQIKKVLNLPKDFLKIMYIDPKSDARYQRGNGTHCIFINLARFKHTTNWYFWLFAVARELTYIRTPRLSYRFVNQLRDLLAVALTKTKD